MPSLFLTSFHTNPTVLNQRSIPAEEAGQECKACISSRKPRRPDEISSPAAASVAAAAAERPSLSFRYFQYTSAVRRLAN